MSVRLPDLGPTGYGIYPTRLMPRDVIVKLPDGRLAAHPLMMIQVRAAIERKPSAALAPALAWLVEDAHRKLDAAGRRL
jgi:hypothetical protein